MLKISIPVVLIDETLKFLSRNYVEGKEKKSEIPVIDYVVKAKTYRYVGNAESAAANSTTQGAQ